MSQSSLREQFEEAGIKVKRGAKVRPDAEGASPTARASNTWLYRWARNSYRNFERVSRSEGVRRFVDVYKDSPAIVVGVGPSLDFQWDALRRAAGRAIIVSTDAAFRALMANGITPDAVLSFDCKPEQRLLWDQMPRHDVPAFFDSCAHPEALDSYKAPKFFYNHWHQTDQLSELVLPHVFPHLGQLPSAGTVGNVAALLARLFGCNPVIAVGMDFCYPIELSGSTWRYRATDYVFNPDDGLWHATEIRSLYDDAERSSRTFLRTIKGVEYRMDPELEFYHSTFVALMAHFKVPIVNCSVSGALKDFYVTLGLDDALDRFCPVHLYKKPLTELRR